MNTGVTEPAPAKVNLYLHVTGCRTDGYHTLDSLVVFAGIGDTVQAAPAGTLSLAITGPEAGSLAAEPDNLVLRAARGLAAAAGREAAATLRLTKRLPVASGIGGGSADAAAALRALGALWGTRTDDATALALGADVPACLACQPVRMSGIGEVLGPVPPIPKLGIVLANPRLALPTPAVFARRSGPFSPPAALAPRWPDLASFVQDLGALRNDLEAPAMALCPPIAEVLSALRALPGCLLARMSGSGATCFGLFATPAAAAAAARLLPAIWWHWGGGVFDAPVRAPQA
ncbi:4-(cytidine 5'-diphospho)-2-C-methyl-D-erythritol kinase [Roseomonas sp. HJA6]|uniref:4-diphosphocytidyl-2-C-methyl-D-erythritol kinase n=1 Tax=Roseomonas alba TaxID=2846776 RepID=A0ABS7AHA1_9PROT|nr:4-(cytidine 5'-diphospho)-2-C-methyl-D-erythritol kinase [Neoroseomonas alba]MBW6401680.1 4-(cytidine 5'-diphospho)-2-C-methyl-D-erythritol kinase [Neoroseomonas alba]